MTLIRVTLDDKYTLTQGRAFVTGTQALVRLCLEQRGRDALAGHETAGYVTGYRGSPLGSVDKEFWRAETLLKNAEIRFQAAVNEDLAATAIWGAQQLPLFKDARKDGVFAIWYGKGPGVDRAGDVFRHANLAGTSALGGVLALAGDDPGCKSSTVPSQSDFALVDAGMPLLHPADAQEILDFGLLGFAMSRFSGCWVGMKAVADVMDTSASIALDPARVRPVLPADCAAPPGGLHLRWPDPPMEQENRLYRFKIPAAAAFARANAFDRLVWDPPKPRLGLVASGKTYRDVREALSMLGIDELQARALGIRLLKIGCAWPLDGEIIRRFARDLEDIVVVEEKRPLLETQIKDHLYGLGAKAPRIVGKHDETGAWLFPPAGEVGPAEIARALGPRLVRIGGAENIAARLERLEKLDKHRIEQTGANAPATKRIPYFCAGCPHNTSTHVPEGSRALAGIGCHYMAIWMNRDTATFSHMGGEGAAWIGQAPFSDTPHVFANIGDGTYFHSGLLAIRAAVASGVNMTYKILYNDAVAMTGGQPHDGPLDVPRIAAQVRAEGVERIAVVSDEPELFRAHPDFVAGVTVHHRDDLDDVQRTLREWPGVSAIIYAQTCAAEKRRRRKRGRMPDPPRRAFINEAVCEGCGDCGVQSNCVAIAPLETELGRKRAIDQSACNKDFSCLKGFCPSFVTVEGGRLRRREGAGPPAMSLPEPARAGSAGAYGIVVSGIGGTGVVTIGAILGMAAHIEGRGVSVLDVAGLAQKNGEVYGHIRIAAAADGLHAARIGAGEADLLIGCDLITAASGETLPTLAPDRTRAVVNAHETMTATFTHDPDTVFSEDRIEAAIAATTRARDFVDATSLAVALLGDSVGANMLLLGFACQKGLLPVSPAAIDAAIALNGVALDFNRHAFAWGRMLAVDPGAVARAAGLAQPRPLAAGDDLPGFIERRAAELTLYQNRAYAQRYTDLIERVRAAEAKRAPGRTGLVAAVARSYYKLLAYKDEYEVARLYTDGRFQQALERTFEEPARIIVHLAPPLFAERDPRTGTPQKRAYGPWMLTAMRLLAPLKALRGTPLDPFGRTEERLAERRLIADYESLIAELLERLTSDTHALATELAAVPLAIRGFGQVKARAMATAKTAEAALLARLRKVPGGANAKAAE